MDIFSFIFFSFLSSKSKVFSFSLLHYVSIYLNNNYFYRALLIKIKKLKRINLLAQKLKRTHRQLLTGRGLKKAHIKNYNISPSIKTRQNIETDLISSLEYTDLYKVSI